MGEVYKARDTRLGRSVAIKVLPRHFSADAEARQRFEREAQTIASLSHPHICVLHDMGRERPSGLNRSGMEEPIDFLVMEYLQGVTLAERLAKGPLPVAEAIAIALQIADALDEAHRSGIVHRDLKPANVFLVAGAGLTAKLLDFGLAKPAGLVRASSAAGVDVTAAATGASDAITAQGTIVGTFQYMAPEQIEGREVDARTDIFAFGAMLYEMLTGRPAFQGGSQASIMAAILAGQTPSLTLPERVAPHLDHIIQGCLRKNPAERWQSIRDVAFELRSTTDPRDPLTMALAASASTAPPKRSRLPWLIGVPAAMAIAALGAALMNVRQPVANVPTIRFEVPVAGSSFFVSVSPDGRMLAYNAPGTDGRGAALWVRPVDSLEARIVPGTSGNPDWSPDGRFLVFNAPDGTLKRVELQGGQAQTIAPLKGAGYQRATWSADGVVVFSSGTRLYRVPATGGEPVLISQPDPALNETSHATPWFLPGGRRFLYTAWSNDAEKRAIYIGTIDVDGSTDEERAASARASRVRLMTAESKAVYVEPGYLLYLQNRALMARPFDADRLEFTGEPHRIADNVLYNPLSGAAAFGASSGGTIVYRRGGPIASPDGNREWVWFDRSGQRSARVGSPHGDSNVVLSHDGTRLAFVVGGMENGDVWVEDLTRGLRTRLTSRADSEIFPTWSPDDTRLVFASLNPGERDSRGEPVPGKGHGDVHVIPANGAVPDRLLAATDVGTSLLPGAWSGDGRSIIAARVVSNPSGGQASSLNLWVIPVDGGKPAPYLTSNFMNVQPALSPDGRWLAYTTNESGGWQVVVQPFPDPAGGKVQVSTGGGMAPRWRADGRELFYLTPNRQMMAVPVSTGPRFEVGGPAMLFEAPLPNLEIVGMPYAVAPDGKRFLVSVPIESPVANTPLAVITNWASSLRD